MSSVNQFTSLSKQIGEIRLLIDARDFSAAGCDHIDPSPCYVILPHDSGLTLSHFIINNIFSVISLTLSP